MKKSIKKLNLKKVYCANLILGGDDGDVDRSKIKVKTNGEIKTERNCPDDGV